MILYKNNNLKNLGHQNKSFPCTGWIFFYPFLCLPVVCNQLVVRTWSLGVLTFPTYSTMCRLHLRNLKISSQCSWKVQRRNEGPEFDAADIWGIIDNLQILPKAPKASLNQNWFGNIYIFLSYFSKVM